MGREIVTQRDVEAATRRLDGTIAKGGAASPPVRDKYRDRLVKNIPAEVVASYVFLAGLVKGAADSPPWLLWAIFGALLVITPLYLYRLQNVRKPLQLAVSTAAFAVWVFSLGDQGPFAGYDWYRPIYGAVLLPLYTFLIAIVQPQTRKT